MWITIAIAIIAIYWYIFRRSENQQEESAYIPNANNEDNVRDYTLKGILQKLGADITDEDENGYHTAKYQGGTFMFRLEPTYMDIFYPHFFQFAHEDLHVGLLACNYVNIESAIWKSFITLTDTANGEKVCSTSLSCRVDLKGNVDECVHYIRDGLETAFHISRRVKESFESNMKLKQESESGLENDPVCREKFRALFALSQRLRENGQLEEYKEEAPADASLLLNNIMQIYDASDFGCLLSMKITCDNEVETVTDISKITSFRLRDYIRNHPDANSIRNIVIVYEFEHQTLFVNLAKTKGSTASTLFFMMNITRSGNEEELNVSLQKRMQLNYNTMFEVRLTDEDKDYWEAKFMFDDAKDKLESRKASELTPEQHLLVNCAFPSIQSDIYWGYKFYRMQCYPQALALLKRAFEYLVRNASNDEEREQYHQIAYYIGFIYMEMGILEKAHYYLGLSLNTGCQESYMEFANCLTNLNDPRAKDFIINIRETIVNMMNEQEEPDEGTLFCYRFLNRRLAYILIEKKEYDDAEKLLKGMIEHGDDVEFAEQELEHINNKREQKNEQTDNPE